MIIVTGGAYQGKLDYVKEHYPIQEDEIFTCSSEVSVLDLTKKVVYGFDKWILAVIEKGMEPVSSLKAIIDDLQDKIIIVNDISCGVVPIDPTVRQWREAVGRGTTLLSKQADTVIRVFCGIGTVLK